MGISFAIFAATRPERGIALWSIGQLVFGFLAITTLPSMTLARLAVCLCRARAAGGSASDRVAALETAANWAGLTAGPLIAGELLALGAGARVQWLSILLDAAALLTLLPLMRGRARS
jgi:hypothetical protein